MAGLWRKKLETVIKILARGGKFWPWPFLALIVALYGLVQVRCVQPVFNEPDPKGYLLPARAMASGRSVAFSDSDPFLFQDHVWVQNGRGEILSKYAPGYSMVLAFSRLLLGEDSVF